MKRLKFYCLLLVLPCLALQCNKDNDDPDPDNGNGNNKEQLPPATQSGENTFGCLVNGEVWRAKIKEPSPYNKVIGSYRNGSLLVGGNREILKNDHQLTQFIRVYLGNKAYLKGKYMINDSLNYGKFINIKSRKSNKRKECRYSNNSSKKGFIEVTKLDSIKNIASGRFRFTAVNDSCGDVDTIRVTKGRFDIKYAH
jgi:hypothetical protein